MTGAGPLVHADRCPEPPPIIRAWPTRHGDTVSWCPACCHESITPSATRVHESDPERMATSHQEES